MVAAVIPQLTRHADVVILATDAAARVLAVRHTNVIARAGVCTFVPRWMVRGAPLSDEDPGVAFVELRSPADLCAESDRGQTSPTQIRLSDSAGAERLLRALIAELRRLTPDVVLRTTPSSHIGVDELAATAAARIARRPIVRCVQDYYGVGFALGDGEHAVANVGVRDIATVDEAAAAMLAPRTGRQPVVVGWAALDGMLTGPGYAVARREGRQICGIDPSDRFVVYACGPDAEGSNEMIRDFQVVSTIVLSLADEGVRVRFGYREHPRQTAAERNQMRALSAEAEQRGILVSAMPRLSYRQCLATPDAIVSAMSMVNIDALALQSVARAECERTQGTTVSIYTTEEPTRALTHRLTGLDLLPTHRPGAGSLCATYADLANCLRIAFTDAAAWARLAVEADRLYLPDGRATERLVAFALGSHTGPSPSVLST